MTTIALKTSEGFVFEARWEAITAEAKLPVIIWSNMILDAFYMVKYDNGFYMVKYDLPMDKERIMSEGPWMLFDHYLDVS